MRETLCPADHDLLPGTTREPVSAEVQAHLDGCAPCRQRLERLKAEVRQLCEAVARRSPRGPPAGARNQEELLSPGPGRTPQLQAGLAAPKCRSPAPRLAAIGKYRIVAPLDEGGQAWVYRAVHPELYKELVIKLGRRPLVADPVGQERLVAEGRLLADVEHPNLARVYDLDFHEGRPFLVLEYVRGPDLQQYAAAHRLAPRAAAALVAQLARALAAAHARGILHQDVKPRNIVLDETGRPRLLDFGMARLLRAGAGDPGEAIGGTPEYMAPEQARGEAARVDQRSDLFALGAVFYFLLTGKAPFTGTDREEALARAARCDWDRSALRTRSVPRRLAAVCRRALAAEPAARYARAENLATDLERSARPPRVFAGLAVVGVALLLLVGAGWWWWLHGKPSPLPEGPPRVLVYREGHVLGLKNAVPLRPGIGGDKVQIRCALPRGLHAALFWFTTEGKLQQLATRSPTDALEELVYPPHHVVTLEGPPGTELILVCGWHAQPPAAEAVERIFARVGRLPPMPLYALVVLDRHKVTPEVERGPGLVEAGAIGDVEQRLDLLRAQLCDGLQAEFLIGVAFTLRD
jgi:tRNA A-37 threonylcarbamoyl transferase component Bud32